MLLRRSLGGERRESGSGRESGRVGRKLLGRECGLVSRVAYGYKLPQACWPLLELTVAVNLCWSWLFLMKYCWHSFSMAELKFFLVSGCVRELPSGCECSFCFVYHPLFSDSRCD